MPKLLSITVTQPFVSNVLCVCVLFSITLTWVYVCLYPCICERRANRRMVHNSLPCIKHHSLSLYSGIRIDCWTIRHTAVRLGRSFISSSLYLTHTNTSKLHTDTTASTIVSTFSISFYCTLKCTTGGYSYLCLVSWRHIPATSKASTGSDWWWWWNVPLSQSSKWTGGYKRNYNNAALVTLMTNYRRTYTINFTVTYISKQIKCIGFTYFYIQ